MRVPSGKNYPNLLGLVRYIPFIECSNHINSILTKIKTQMASSFSSPSDLANYSRSWSYHVFLSFRGEDTRLKFVGHLYKALMDMGIYMYKDNKEISYEELIDTSVTEVIEGSQIAIIVFSENFAESSWCLRELAYIIDCEKRRGLTVVPIFYDVEPTVVRKQKRKYEEAFSQHELKNESDVVASRRKTLREVSGHSGDEFKSASMDESDFIKKIVNGISKMIHPLTPRKNDKLVGIEDRMHNLISQMQIGLDVVLMIGIWGLGGGGKTTLANSVYSEISWKFDCSCRIQDIRENSRSVEDGNDMISEKLRRKKVLILLDDVDKRNQLEALAGSPHWFGEGSRIIITTRDAQLLRVHKVNNVHEVSLLKECEAISLLCKHADLERPMGDYKKLTEEVVSYACGLPLALEIVGSSLYDANINEWKDTLDQLKSIPNDDIVGKLKISYDGLAKVVKELFLDIACFHRREEEASAMAFLDACKFHPISGVKVLKDRALITISNGRFDMHDLNVSMIEALRFKYNDYIFPQRKNPLQHLPPIIANSKNLRWIDWEGDLANPLLTNFPPTTLCCLILTGSKQKQLWEGYKFLPCMKIMELSVLTYLTRTPDFSGIPNLERFKLHGSMYLEEIDSSFGLLENLVFVSIERCPRIKRFPSINRLKNLETLSFRFCKAGLFELPKIQQNMGSVAHPELGNSGETQVQKPSSSHNNMNRHTRLWVSHSNLTKLDLYGCDLEDANIGSLDWELPSLKELHLSDNNFSRLDFSLLGLPKLKWLDVSWCESLVELKDLPSSISVIQADGCISLERKLHPSDGAALLKSVLKGNAIDQNHFISVNLPHQIPWVLKEASSRGETFRLQNDTPSYVDTFRVHLRDNWDNDFCGLLMRLVTQELPMSMEIKISKHESDKEYDYVFLKDSNEEPEPEYDEEVNTYVGYVSFSALRQTTSLNSSYNTISFSIKDDSWNSLTAELVPRKNKDDPLQTTKAATNSPEFWDDKDEDYPSFKIEHDSKSFVNIQWNT
ncbi:hypothetical protein LXL04_021770 [Taraxacum kok-saghyz]